MKLAVFSHKPCWPCATSSTGYATDGGFPFQMAALAELFDETVLLVPCAEATGGTGEIPLKGPRLRVAPLPAPYGAGLGRKMLFPFWLLRCAPIILKEFHGASAVHAPIPGDVGTVGMLLAWVFRKPLFVRYCGNWLAPVTLAQRFWRSFMETFAGGRNVMLATGGTVAPPSPTNPNVRWIFSSSLTAGEMEELGGHQPALAGAKLRLITVGRQQAGKGTDKLIEALAVIRRQWPEVQLDVVGDGSELARLKAQAAELGVSGQVVFHGKLDHAGVLGRLKQAHIFCFPTRSEGFPKAVLEAMACGLPVIATSVSVLPMLLSTGGGILIEPSAAAVARAVCEISSSEEKFKAMSAKARDMARAYTLERWRDTIGGHLSAAWGLLRKIEDKRVKMEAGEAETNVLRPPSSVI